MRAWEHSDTLTAAGGGSCSGGSFYGVVGGSQGAVQLRRAAFHNHGPRSASSLHSMTTSFQTATITSVEDAMPAYTKHR